jgi:hypothetical protein
MPDQSRMSILHRKILRLNLVGAGNKNAINIGYNNSILDSYLGHCKHYWCCFQKQIKY